MAAGRVLGQTTQVFVKAGACESLKQRDQSIQLLLGEAPPRASVKLATLPDG